MSWQYIKHYCLVRSFEVEDFASRGYELVGGAVYGDGIFWQAMALYDDEVTQL